MWGAAQDPAEQPPASGIRIVANTGSEKSILLLSLADKGTLPRAPSDGQGFDLTSTVLLVL